MKLKKLIGILLVGLLLTISSSNTSSFVVGSGGTLKVGSGGNFILSNPGGTTWVDTGVNPVNTAWCFGNFGGGIVTCGVYGNDTNPGHIFRSTNYGVDWADLGQQGTETTFNAMIGLSGGVGFAGTTSYPLGGVGGVIFRTADSGATWTSLGQQFSQTFIGGFADFGNGIVAAGTGPHGKVLRLIPDIVGGLDKTDLISWWDLEEESGTRNDVHGTNHLTDNNTVGYAVGKVGNAAQFVAANTEYLSHVSNSDLQMGDIDFTIGAWFNLHSRDWRAIMGKWQSANQEYGLIYWSDTNRLGFHVGSNGSDYTLVQATSFGLPPLDEWHFVMGWHDSVKNTINIQVDNGAVDSSSYSLGVFGGNATFLMGAFNAGVNTFWDGLIDSAFVLKRVLTADERTWLYNSGNGRSYSQLGETIPSTWLDLGMLNYPTVTQIQSMIGWPSGIGLLAGTGPAGDTYIYRTTDFAANWTLVDTWVGSSWTQHFGDLGGGIVLAGTFYTGTLNGVIMRSTDYGEHWVSVGQPVPGNTGATFAFANFGNGVVVCGADPGAHIARSTDWGEHWTDLGAQSSQSAVMDIVYLGNNIGLAGTEPGKILRSTY